MISAETSSWPGGQRERQALVERRQQPTATRARLASELGQRRPPARHHQLGHQRLVEPEATLGRLHLGPRVGRVDVAQGGRQVGQPVVAAYVVGNRVGQLVDHA